MKFFKKKRIIIIVISKFVICIISIFFLFSFVFKLFWVNTSVPLEQNYKDKMISTISVDIPRLITFPPSKKSDQIGYFIFMFQWDYDELLCLIEDDIKNDLRALKQKYENVDEYNINFETMTADIYCRNIFRDGSWFVDEEIGISSCYNDEWYLELKEVVNKRINSKCHQYYNLKYQSEPAYFWHPNPYAAKMDVSAYGCVRIWSKGEILHQDGVDMEEPPIPSDEEIEEIKQKAKENKNRIDE